MQRPLISDAPEEQMVQYVEVSFGRRGSDGSEGRPFQEATQDRRGQERRVGEQRRVQRRRVLLSALVVKRDFDGIFRCGVHDVSELGARLKIPGGLLLPAEFWLIAASAGMAYEAETVWRRYPSVGVTLGEPVDLHDPTTRAARRLRTLWMSVSS